MTKVHTRNACYACRRLVVMESVDELLQTPTLHPVVCFPIKQRQLAFCTQQRWSHSGFEQWATFLFGEKHKHIVVKKKLFLFIPRFINDFPYGQYVQHIILSKIGFDTT